jgi:ribonuclease HI
MDSYSLFTDGSVNPVSRIGYGAYFMLKNEDLDSEDIKVNTKRFHNTSSTKLELQSLIWALTNIDLAEGKITVYTDSTNVMGLKRRRTRLEKSNYFAKNNKRLNNYELYQKFYQLMDQYNCEFVKVRGHAISSQKDKFDKLFTLVDRASRKALRQG